MGDAPENSASDTEKEISLLNEVPEILNREAIFFSVFMGIFCALLSAMFQFYFNDFKLNMINGDIVIWVGLFSGLASYGSYILGVQHGDDYGNEVEHWRKREKEIEQYRQTDDYAQKMSELEAERKKVFKKSGFWVVTKIWVGFCSLILLFILVVNLF